MYEITYPAPTNPQLSRYLNNQIQYSLLLRVLTSPNRQISDLLTSHGVQNELDTKRGWDHGVFLPLKLMFPEASIPVISVCIIEKGERRGREKGEREGGERRGREKGEREGGER